MKELLIVIAIGVLCALLALDISNPNPLVNSLTFTVGDIKMYDQSFCEYSFGKFNSKKEFKSTFRITAQCGEYAAGEKITFTKTK